MYVSYYNSLILLITSFFTNYIFLIGFLLNAQKLIYQIMQINPYRNFQSTRTSCTSQINSHQEKKEEITCIKADQMVNDYYMITNCCYMIICFKISNIYF